MVSPSPAGLIWKKNLSFPVVIKVISCANVPFQGIIEELLEESSYYEATHSRWPGFLCKYTPINRHPRVISHSSWQKHVLLPRGDMMSQFSKWNYDSGSVYCQISRHHQSFRYFRFLCRVLQQVYHEPLKTWLNAGNKMVQRILNFRVFCVDFRIAEKRNEQDNKWPSVRVHPPDATEENTFQLNFMLHIRIL